MLSKLIDCLKPLLLFVVISAFSQFIVVELYILINGSSHLQNEWYIAEYLNNYEIRGIKLNLLVLEVSGFLGIILYSLWISKKGFFTIQHVIVIFLLLLFCANY